MKIRQITYSDTETVAYPDTEIPMPVEPDMHADWTMVAAVWQQVTTKYGGLHWRWVWFWEGVRS